MMNKSQKLVQELADLMVDLSESVESNDGAKTSEIIVTCRCILSEIEERVSVDQNLSEHIDTSVPIHETTGEICPDCETGEQEIPSDKPSLCKNCGSVLFPCSACWEVREHKKDCDWHESDGCWRFSYASRISEKATICGTKLGN